MNLVNVSFSMIVERQDGSTLPTECTYPIIGYMKDSSGEVWMFPSYAGSIINMLSRASGSSTFMLDIQQMDGAKMTSRVVSNVKFNAKIPVG